MLIIYAGLKDKHGVFKEVSDDGQGIAEFGRFREQKAMCRAPGSL